MKKKTVIGVIIFGIALAGCIVALTPAQTEHLASADARMEKLAAKYPEIADEFKLIRGDIQASGVTPTELAAYSLTGGIVGRSLLHTGATFGGVIPGVGPLLAGLCSWLLAGSQGRKK